MTTPPPPTLEHLHARVVDHLDRRVRWLGVMGVVIVALTLAGVSVLLPAGDDGERSALPLALDAAAVLVLAGGAWWWRRARRRLLDEARIAAGIEAAAGVPAGVVRGGIELGRQRPSGASAVLLERGRSQLAARLDHPPEVLAGVAGERLGAALRRAMGAVAVLAPVVVLLFVAAPDRARTAWSRLASPLTHFRGPVLPALVVTPGDAEVVRGEALAVVIRAEGRDEVTVRWQAAGDVVRSLTLAVADDHAHHTFAGVPARTVYAVEAPDGTRAGDFVITPRDPLFVTDVTARLTFPPHTGRPSEEYRGDLPPLRIPAGTRLTVEGQGSRPLAEARLVPLASDSLRGDGAGGDEIDLEVEGARFHGAWVPSTGVWEWHFRDAAGGAAGLRPTPLDVTVLADAPPTIAIARPAPDTTLPLDLRQPLELHAADDYGVARLELVAWRVTALGEVREPVRQPLDVGDSRAVIARPVMDFAAWGLLPGDEVRYYARAIDNHPGAQDARTEEYRLRMPGAMELRREAGAEVDRTAGELQSLAEQALAAAEATRNLERKAQSPARAAERAPLDFAERAEIESALAEQREMAARVDSLGRALDELSRTLSDAGAHDEGLRREMAQMRQLLDESAGEAMQAELEQMTRRLEAGDRDGARESLEQLARAQEDFRDRLEEAVERMKRMGAQEDFRATTREAEELAERQRALAEAMADDVTPRRADEQDALRTEAEAMEARMEALAERLRELGEDEAAAGVEQARADTREAARQMETASSRARDGQAAEASAGGEEAAAGIEEAAVEMSAARDEMNQERDDALQRALEQTAQDALSLARRQSEVGEAMEGASADQLAALRPAAAGVQQGLRNMAEHLQIAALAGDGGGSERPVMTALGEAMAAVEEGIRALDAPSGGAGAPQAAAEGAVDALNQVAMESLAAAQQMAAGGSGSGASQEAVQDQLQQLAQQQADVNNRAARMMPVDVPPESRRQQMETLAREQQEVASQVGEVAREEQGAGALGDLHALAREAEALAREIAGGRLEAEVRERQERLFHRLLDAGRSLENDEFSDEREGTSAGLVARGEVAPLDAEALGILHFRPDAEALGRLPPAARALVVRYFDRLNEAPPPRGSGAPAAGAGGGR